MHRTYRLGTLLALCGLLFATPAAAESILVDFNENFTPYLRPCCELRLPRDYRRVYTDYTANGVTFGGTIEVMESDYANEWHEANLAGVNAWTPAFPTNNLNPLTAVNGTGIMRPSGESGHFELTTTGGGLFTVQSMQLLMGFDGGELGATSVTFRGYRNGLQMGALSIPLLWHGTVGGVPPGVDIGWTNADLRSLGQVDQVIVTGLPTITAPYPGYPDGHFQDSAEFWVDDVRVHRVPEPSTAALLLLGTLATGVAAQWDRTGRRRDRSGGR